MEGTVISLVVAANLEYSHLWMKISPPTLIETAGISWALSSAFGPPGTVPISGACPARPGVDFLLRSHLGPRVASRFGRARLTRELGRETAAVFVGEWEVARAAQLYFIAVARRVAATAAGLGVPLMFMKGMALLLGGFVEPGRRYFQDIDVLVSGARAEELWSALVEGGMRPGGTEMVPHHQHLRPLLTNLGGCVEIHRRFPGFRSEPGQATANLSRLVEAGACSKPAGFPAGTWVPRADLLAASMLAHTFGHHFRGSASGYFGLRLVADLVDLFPLVSATDEAVARWLDVETYSDLVTAVGGVVDHFAGGSDPAELIVSDSEGGRLLVHMIALEVDADYRWMAHVSHVTNGFSLAGWWRRLFYSWSLLETSFGGSAAALRWYLCRPWQLGSLIVRTVAAWSRGRRRRLVPGEDGTENG